MEKGNIELNDVFLSFTYSFLIGWVVVDCDIVNNCVGMGVENNIFPLRCLVNESLVLTSVDLIRIGLSLYILMIVGELAAVVQRLFKKF